MIRMATLLDKPAVICRMLAIPHTQAEALGDAARTQILSLLYRRDMTIEQIHTALKEAGLERASSTIRHHVRVLREAGLVQVTRIEEVRGTVSKHYGTNTRLFDCEVRADIDEVCSKLIQSTKSKMDRILPTVLSKIPRPDDMPESYYQCVAVDILSRAIALSLEDAE